MGIVSFDLLVVVSKRLVSQSSQIFAAFLYSQLTFISSSFVQDAWLVTTTQLKSSLFDAAVWLDFLCVNIGSKPAKRSLHVAISAIVFTHE